MNRVMQGNNILFGLLFFLSFSIYGKTITICNECSLNTIKKAILNSEANDTIVVKKGTYKEYNIVVNKPLTIIGEDYPVIDGELKGEIFTIIADNVTLDGLIIINVGTSYTEDYAAVRVIKSKNFLIQNMPREKKRRGRYQIRNTEMRVRISSGG